MPGRDKVLFLDRDGVINVHVWPAPRSWEQFAFLPGVPDALAEATREGWRIVVATNKGAVGAKLISRKVSDEINRLMVAELAAAGARVEAVYACNHFPHGFCECRKPKPGMLLAAKRDLQLDPAICWMVGDNATDVAAGKAAGCETALLRTVKTPEVLEKALRKLDVGPTVWADDLPAAWRDAIRPSGRRVKRDA